ncbi:DUF6332 family protein [Streptomyces sp. NRRL S-337]|uniref:DUF6332 family protein n=1 Tax=Streptomyces sp. NRRL S-337 TaxID=1463900 RepID=UPI0004C96E7A|nr:DUF6332 family protein [Streptomyces sp. NRRL S-337]
MSPARSRAERDAITVEIMFALVSGGFLGVAGFLVLGSAVLWAGLPGGWKGPWLTVSAVVGGVLFVVQVVRVLRRPYVASGGRASVRDVVWRPGQPSQPGRTSPDS